MWDAVTGAVSNLTSGAMDAMFGGLYDKLVALIKNAILTLFGFGYIAVAGAYLLVAQVLLTILAAVGPIFFGFGLFPATRQFFNNWVGSVLNYGFFFLFATILVDLSLTVIDSQLDAHYQGLKEFYGGALTGSLSANAAASSVAGSFGSVGILIALFIVFTVVLFQLPQLTSSLFSGLAAGGYSKMLSQAKNAAVLAKLSGGNKGGGGGGGSPNNQIGMEKKGK